MKPKKDHSIIRLMIVDDHRILAESMARLIQDQPDLEIVALASSGKEAIARLKEPGLEVGLVLMDLRMGEAELSEPDGLISARYILKNLYLKGVREIKILVITQLMDGYLIDLAHKIGVHGYLSKDCDSEELFEAIRSIALHNRRYYRGSVAEAWDKFSYEFSGRQHLPDLTPTESEILQMIAEGLTTREIAEKRGRGIDGVEAHRRNLMRKFEAKNAPHLISLAFHFGMIK